mmetsp:Transcript_63108/g.163119  ORF Transcript_63108/g.163119 Transcript_63108/m.163119 type:complete len:107 (-) Transcript_63108:206-526(-)
MVIFVSTLTANISSNIIPPANDFLNLWPERLQWRSCAYATMLLALLVCPLYVFHSPTGFALKFLGGYGMVTGAHYGVLVSDYYIVRGRCLNVSDLYPSNDGQDVFE